MTISREEKLIFINSPHFPQVMIKPRLNACTVSVPLLTNPAGKFELTSLYCSDVFAGGGGVVGVGPPQLHQYISKTHVRACEKYTKKSSDPHSSFFLQIHHCYTVLYWMNLNKLLLSPSKLNFSLLALNNVSNFLTLQIYFSAVSNDIIPAVSSSARNLGFIFDSDTSFSDQINSVAKSFHFHIRDIRPIRHLLPATALANSLVSNLTTAIHYTLASHKQISTNFNAFKTHWHVSSQTLQNFNTSHQHSKNYTGFQSNKESITKLCLLSYKTLTNQQPTYLYNIVFHLLQILFVGLPIHSFFLFHMSDHHSTKGFSVIGPRFTTLEFTPSRYPKLVFSTNIPFQAQNTPLQNCVPSLGSFLSPLTVLLDFNSCYFYNFMPYRMTPSVRHRAIEVPI